MLKNMLLGWLEGVITDASSMRHYDLPPVPLAKISLAENPNTGRADIRNQQNNQTRLIAGANRGQESIPYPFTS